MTAPVVPTTGRTQSRVNTGGTSHTAALPTQLAGGLFLVVSAITGSGVTVTMNEGGTQKALTVGTKVNGWSILANDLFGSGTTTERLIIMSKVRPKDSVEAAPVFTTSVNTLSSHISWFITGHSVVDPLLDIVVGALGNAASGAAVAPASTCLAKRDNLVIAAGAVSQPSTGTTGGPSGYTQYRNYSTTTTNLGGSQVFGAEFAPASGATSLSAASFASGGSGWASRQISIPGTGIDGLLAEWGFTEGSGSSAAEAAPIPGAALVAAGTPAWNANGKNNSAVDINNSRWWGKTSLYQMTKTAWTLMAWVKLSSNPTTSYAQVFYDNNNMWAEIQSDGRWGYYGTYSASPLPLNQWVHLAWVSDGTNVVCYQDGVAVATHAGGVDFNTAAPFTVGKGADGAIIGLLDEPRIFDGVLSAAQIQSWAATPIGPGTGPTLLQRLAVGSTILAPNKVMLGAAPVDKVFVGSTQIFP